MNSLMQQPQMQQPQMQQPQMQQPGNPQQPMPQAQVNDLHGHLSDREQSLDELIKKPDHELDLPALYGAAADLVTKHAESRGKMGASAIHVAAELASKDFPTKDKQGNPPPPEVIRKYLQDHFDKTVLMHAQLTAKLGGPRQQMPPQSMPQNQLTQPQ
jgi:hypothetical protein